MLKKIAYTSISAAIINLVVDVILINKIRIFAASVSTLIAFVIMFLVRYIDVNKTIHMKIKKNDYYWKYCNRNNVDCNVLL